MTDGSNDRTHRAFYGGPPMVRINGARARQFREEQGLTQLYIATVVGVTTDTISRWENRKTPSVKKENALKLAEALGVDLDTLLYQEESEESRTGDRESEVYGDVSKQGPDATGSDGKEGRAPGRQISVQHKFIWLLAAFVALVALSGSLYWYKRINSHRMDIVIEANRLLPPHAPAGGTFPVIVTVSSGCPEKLSLIVTEYLPEGSKIVKSIPPWSASTPDRKKIKWIATTSRASVYSVCYIVHISPDAPGGAVLEFNGEVTSSLTGRKIFQIKGPASLEVAPFHWADINSDGQIDDEEILRVFDELGERKGLDFGLDEIKKIWSSGNYHWDGKKKQYIPVRQENQNEN